MKLLEIAKGHRVSRTQGLLLALCCYAVFVACVAARPGSVAQHRWWAGLGPVLPHDSFPADCTLCHEGATWNDLKDDFRFDHAAETGVPLNGAHRAAQCLRCHNDRGPVEVFQARGCGGCHEDIHQGQLGGTCTDCHDEVSWRPQGMLALHDTTRFPLFGVHAAVSCRQCHLGAEVGRFVPTPIECVDCHANDLANANNPNHIALGWTFDCNRCHQPTLWNAAELDPNFPN
ncbi:MAG: cytochrome c3 family protein [Planctomycetota bacterium]